MSFLRNTRSKFSSFLDLSHLNSGTVRRQACSLNGSDESVGNPKHAQVVICGGGVVGTSVAYHLAASGLTDITLLEQGRVSCGTTWHAAGLIGQLKGTMLSSEMSKYSRDLYASLEQQGHGLGWKQCGSLNVARTKGRMTFFKRQLAWAKVLGIESHLVTPQDIKELCPLLRDDDLEGGIWIPGDGVVSPTDVTNVFVKLAKEKGVKIVENCKVKKVDTENRKVKAVETDLGRIECQYFVNCAGLWARQVGKLSIPRIIVPLHSCEHFYIVTKPCQVPNMTPVVRDYDGYIYLREWSGGILGGGFEPVAKPAFFDGIPDKFEFQQLPDDWDHFQVLLEQILHRIPSLNDAEIRSMLNGPESFTPDAMPIMGESPQIECYFMAAAMNSQGISLAPSMGQSIVKLMTGLKGTNDCHTVCPSRFMACHNNKKFLYDRAKEIVGYTGSVPYPLKEFKQGRRLRTSPLHLRLEASGAQFVEQMAFERTAWFNSNSIQDDFVDNYDTPLGTFGKPAWFDDVKREYWGCRNAVCLIDMTSFAKFDIKSIGREVVDYLQYMCSNDIDKGIGTVIHTGMQNKNGGFENDCSLVRIDHNHFFMISPTNQQTRALAWLSKHLPTDGSVQLSDVTSMYTAINVIGPRAKDLMSDLTNTSMTLHDFPSMTNKIINLGYASDIMAMRLTHTAEDGWILYIPNEYALHVYDTLMSAGQDQDYGIQNAGYFALRSLRIERFFAYWGQDMDVHTTPLECNRDFRVKFEMAADFIGKEALLKQKSQGIKRKFIQLFIQGHDLETDPWPWGSEPIYMNGKFAGMTTSSTYGYSVDKLICLGFVQDFDNSGQAKYITNDTIMKGGAQFEVDIAGKWYGARVGILPPKIPPAVSDSYRPSTVH